MLGEVAWRLQNRGDIMTATMVDWERIETMRRQWEPSVERNDAEDSVAVLPTTVSTHCVKAPSADKDTGGVRYYQCGGGRRVVRKKIGAD